MKESSVGQEVPGKMCPMKGNFLGTWLTAYVGSSPVVENSVESKKRSIKDQEKKEHMLKKLSNQQDKGGDIGEKHINHEG